jgi:hypothetical protein
LEEQLIPVLSGKPTLIALNLFGGYKTDEALDLMKVHDLVLSVIPASCTGIVQPLDVSVNHLFKDILKGCEFPHSIISISKLSLYIIGLEEKKTNGII